MDFEVDLVRPRERRAMVLIGAALATIVAVSVMYLRPVDSASTLAPIVSKAPAATRVLPSRTVILNPGTDVYFTWRVSVPGGTGGHRAG